MSFLAEYEILHEYLKIFPEFEVKSGLAGTFRLPYRFPRFLHGKKAV